MTTQNGHQNGITEDEAALYDRQIRLWGVEAQNKMRTSSVLLLTLRGIAVEIAKNIVLAGIGNLTLLDDKDVSEEDLGANFFLREEDVGRKRVQAAAPRIQALNPRVSIKTETDSALTSDDDFLSQFDLVVVTEIDAPSLIELNKRTRKLNKKLFAASSIGMDGWIFADLLDHEFVVDKSKINNGETTVVPTKFTLGYSSFADALKHDWGKMQKRRAKRLQWSIWTTMIVFETQKSNPSTPLTLETLTASATRLLPTFPIDPSLITPSILSRIAKTAPYEFPPSTAILGGIAGQDVLNVLGGKQEPVRNLMVFHGESCSGNVFALGL
ncbi:hypothetical protein T439DRAFT_325070 [Meredithblackwellia eburnea MCA 4105]